MTSEPKAWPRAETAAPGSFAAIIEPVWEGKWLVAAGVALGLLASILFLHIATPRYTAFLQLVPTEQSGVAVNRNITGLASLAGINLPRGQGSQFAFALEVMKGRDVAIAVAADRKLMQRLFAKEWNATTGQWQEPVKPFRGLKEGIKSILAIEVVPWAPPGPSDVQEVLQRSLALSEDQKRSIATVSLSLPDQALAMDLLESVYLATDAHLRARMERRTSAYIDYLSEKLQQVTLAEHREALANALADQERVLMMARTGQPFAADPLGIVSVTDRPAWPNPLVALGVGMMAGLAAGVGAAYGTDWLRRRRKTA